MKTREQELIKYIQACGGVIRFSEILKAGFHPTFIATLLKQQKIERLARGLYKLPHGTLGSHPDLVLAALQAPRGVVCLLSALFFHEATNEIPRQIDLAISQGSRNSKIEYPPVKFYHFEQKSWQAGIEEIKIRNHRIRVYNLAKTVADCFKFRNRIGISVARAALKTAILEKSIKPQAILRYAKICRVQSIVKSLIEMII
ncbi:type IV toxin-antitoxin system AbiEi family antitoxin domain-containing protein [Candidatus Margulisiibacteriota bacterium]